MTTEADCDQVFADESRRPCPTRITRRYGRGGPASVFLALLVKPCLLTPPALGERRYRALASLSIALADEIEDGQTGFLIERALDEARSHQFRPTG
jgi:hypothetical protein